MFQEQQKHQVNIEAAYRFIQSTYTDVILPPISSYLAHFHSYSRQKSKVYFLTPYQQLPNDLQNQLQNDNLYYLHNGSIELQKKQQSSWKKQYQYRDGQIFSLLNYKQLINLTFDVSFNQPQWYKIKVKQKSALSILPINQTYGWQWMRQEIRKSILLSKIFTFSDSQYQLQRKKPKFKQFINNFSIQNYRRDTKICHQGQNNKKIMIIAQGEAKVSKLSNIQVQSGISKKNVDILYLKQGSVLGCELFMISSKSIHLLIAPHEKKKNQQKQQQENQFQEKAKKRKKSSFGKRIVQQGGYQLFDPHDNLSNFTITADSAILQVYTISLQKLVPIISERYKLNFNKLIEQQYLTMFRRTFQKVRLAQQRQQKIFNITKSKMNQVIASSYSSPAKRQDEEQIKNSEITGIIGNVGKMKRQQTQKNHYEKVKRKVQVIESKEKQTLDYKKRISQLLQAKLKVNSTYQKKQSQKIANDLADIFMKSNQNRTQDIQRHRNILNIKSKIIQQRGHIQVGWKQLQPDPSQNKNINYNTLNYLTGIKMEDYTDRIKYKCTKKIHEANKIKQQFMKIKSQCKSCNCYQHLQHFSTNKQSSRSLFTRTAYKTSQGWGRAVSRASTGNLVDEPLQTIYNKMNFLSQKSKKKYNHNIHLLKLSHTRVKLDRKRSAPIIH